jgi:hypothetical protein
MHPLSVCKGGIKTKVPMLTVICVQISAVLCMLYKTLHTLTIHSILPAQKVGAKKEIFCIFPILFKGGTKNSTSQVII